MSTVSDVDQHSDNVIVFNKLIIRQDYILLLVQCPENNVLGQCFTDFDSFSIVAESVGRLVSSGK